jgi:hypothetical protein
MSESTRRVYEIAAFWQREGNTSRFWVRGPVGGCLKLAEVFGIEAARQWWWEAAGTRGETMYRGDAERLAELRLRYDSHEAWMTHAQGYEWANIRSMERSM